MFYCTICFVICQTLIHKITVFVCNISGVLKHLQYEVIYWFDSVKTFLQRQLFLTHYSLFSYEYTIYFRETKKSIYRIILSPSCFFLTCLSIVNFIRMKVFSLFFLQLHNIFCYAAFIAIKILFFE